uniref:Uncharacterized protein n=1 Tax=Timema cristinae TaxID=61476 RepID=A0A7R9CCS6_TIMCR|nr:unnamed protein product [Timema cristinae]
MIPDVCLLAAEERDDKRLSLHFPEQVHGIHGEEDASPPCELELYPPGGDDRVGVSLRDAELRTLEKSHPRAQGIVEGRLALLGLEHETFQPQFQQEQMKARAVTAWRHSGDHAKEHKLTDLSSVCEMIASSRFQIAFSCKFRRSPHTHLSCQSGTCPSQGKHEQVACMSVSYLAQASSVYERLIPGTSK